MQASESEEGHSQQTFFLMKTSFVFIFRRRLKTSWSYAFKMFSRCLQVFLQRRLEDVLQKRPQGIFKTPWRRLEDVLPKRREDVLKTTSKRREEVLKTTSRRISKMSSRHLQDVFETYHQVKLFLLTHLQEVFEIYSIRFWDILRRWLSVGRFA